MRRSCLDCVLKHLGSAAVYLEEISLGYPNYVGFAVGQLDHAAAECLREHPDLAWVIREHRIQWFATRNDKHPHVIPFEALFDYIAALSGTKSRIAVPDEAIAGLDRDSNGNVVFSMDTRP